MHLWSARRILSVAAFAAGLLGAQPAAAISFSTAANTPDFSQLNDPTWLNFCAPTSSADIVYFFGQTYSGLLKGNGFPPPLGTANTGADSIISDLATLMGTSSTGGTTVASLVSGLDSYLETFDGDASTTWDTAALFRADVGSATFRATLESELQAGAGVILLIEWPTGPPSGDYHLPSEPEPGTGLNDPLAHAMAFVGFDTIGGTWSFHDPGNNTTHQWLGATGATDISAVTTGPTTVQISVSGTTANVYGAVITKAIVPEPAAAALFGLALLALALRRR